MKMPKKDHNQESTVNNSDQRLDSFSNEVKKAVMNSKVQDIASKFAKLPSLPHDGNQPIAKGYNSFISLSKAINTYGNYLKSLEGSGLFDTTAQSPNPGTNDIDKIFLENNKHFNNCIEAQASWNQALQKYKQFYFMDNPRYNRPARPIQGHDRGNNGRMGR